MVMTNIYNKCLDNTLLLIFSIQIIHLFIVRGSQPVADTKNNRNPN